MAAVEVEAGVNVAQTLVTGYVRHNYFQFMAFDCNQTFTEHSLVVVLNACIVACCQKFDCFENLS